MGKKSIRREQRTRAAKAAGKRQEKTHHCGLCHGLRWIGVVPQQSRQRLLPSGVRISVLGPIRKADFPNGRLVARPQACPRC